MEQHEEYHKPRVRVLGSVRDLTQSSDKVGSVNDIFTPVAPGLDGFVSIDPIN